MVAATLSVRLFGRFELTIGGHDVPLPDRSRARELLAFLLLHREALRPREVLACALWTDCAAERSRAYLRKALWQLQTALEPHAASGVPILRTEGAWVGIHPDAALSLDVASFECAWRTTRTTPGRALTPAAAALLGEAVALHRGGLLEDTYHEWCLAERERLRHVQLAMLEKLIDYCETHGEYDTGLAHGLELLRHDPAREHTHRQMMRLHALRGDRTGAVRQFRTCTDVLRAELDLDPMPETVRLHEAIRRGAFAPDASADALPEATSDRLALLALPESTPDASVRALLAHIESLGAGLVAIRDQARRLASTLHTDGAAGDAGVTHGLVCGIATGAEGATAPT